MLAKVSRIADTLRSLKVLLALACSLPVAMAVALWERRRAPPAHTVFDFCVVDEQGALLGGGSTVSWHMVRAALAHNPAWRVLVFLEMHKSPAQLYADVARAFGLRFGPAEQDRVRLVDLLPGGRGGGARSLVMLHNILRHLHMGLFCARYALRHGLRLPRVVCNETLGDISYPIKWLLPRTRTTMSVADSLFRGQGPPPSLAGRAEALYLRAVQLLARHLTGAADVVLMNSEWTRAQNAPYTAPGRVVVVHPPCPVHAFSPHREKRCHIVSLGHLRREKRYMDQVEVFAGVLRRLGGPPEPRLVILAGTRFGEGAAILAELRARVAELGLGAQVDFGLDLPVEEIRARVEEAAFGIHTRLGEAFGIALVELMAGGAVLVTWNAGGPKADIVVEDGGAGFLCDSLGAFEERLADLVGRRLRGELALEEGVRARGAARAQRFSEEAFCARLAAVCFAE